MEWEFSSACKTKQCRKGWRDLNMMLITLKVLVTTIDVLGHFWIGGLQHSGRGWGMYYCRVCKVGALLPTCLTIRVLSLVCGSVYIFKWSPFSTFKGLLLWQADFLFILGLPSLKGRRFVHNGKAVHHALSSWWAEWMVMAKHRKGEDRLEEKRMGVGSRRWRRRRIYGIPGPSE